MRGNSLGAGPYLPFCLRGVVAAMVIWLAPVTSWALTVSVPSGSPAVDGAIDSVWASAASQSVANTMGTISSTSDCSGSFRALWDSSNLYVLVEVTDDNKSNDSTYPWDDDSVELYLDGNNDKTTSYDANDRQIVFGWGDTAPVEGDDRAITGVSFSKVDPTTTSYRMEIKVPWSALGVTASGGKNIGIELQITDDDAGGTREGKKAWNEPGPTDSAWSNPSVFGTGTLQSPPSLPSGWTSQDIGGPTPAGSASESGGAWTVKGGGADIWGTTDQFHYAYKDASGDTTVIAKVDTVQNTNLWAKAGVMIRDGTAANAMFASVVVTPGNGVSFQRRTSTGGSATSTTIAGVTAPRWVRLVRSGNSFSAYYGSDGSNWTQIGSALTASIATAAKAGLCVTSHADGTLCTATFSGVSVSGGGSGAIARELWTGVAGNDISQIPNGTTPSSTSTLTSLEGPTNSGDSYAQRIRGYLHAPQTGSYTFWIASDDDSQLWLSTNDSAANKALVASVDGYTSSRQWNKYTSQKSAAISLTAGQRYYVEVLHKEGAGGDNVAVGWAKPGQSTTAPSEVVPGTHLSPWDGTPLPQQVAAPSFSPVAGTYTSAQSITISATTSGASIRYTTNGSTPTSTTGTLYAGPVSISATTTLKAIAYKSGMTDSAVTSGIYTIQASIGPSAPAVSSAPAVDGVVDGLWANAVASSISNVTGAISSTADCSASWRAVWDNFNLYLLVEVTDDAKSNDSTHPWEDDSVEIYLDGNNNKTTSYDSNDRQVVCGWNDATPVEGAGRNIAGVFFGKADPSSTSYKIECAIPWVTLGVSASSGKNVGIDVHVNDDDDGTTREGKRQWNDTTDNAWANPSLFGTATLTGTPPALPSNWAVNRIRFFPRSGFASRMLNGRFTGSNTSETNGFVQLASIGTTPAEGQWTEINFTNSTVYRWVKYEAPAGAFGNVAEVEFYNGTTKLGGRVFGTNGNNGPNTSFAAALDGSTSTYFDSSVDDSQYTGYDLGASVQVAAPGFSPTPGSYSSAQTVTLSTATSGASIRYTTNGSTPSSTSGTLYAGPFTVSTTTTVSAVAYKSGMADSALSTATYTIGSTPPVTEGLVSYHLGNSLTDTINSSLNTIADSTGVDHTYMRSTIPGAPTDWLWNHPGEANGEPDYRVVYDTKGPIDHQSTQPYAGHCRSLANEAEYSGRFYRLARTKSPDIQHWLYLQWPHRTPDDCWSSAEPEDGVTFPYVPATTWEQAVQNHLAYVEAARQLMDDLNDGKPILIVPGGLALADLKQAFDAGQIPGMSGNFFDLHFSDAGHLSSRGSYMIGLVFYSCFYRQSPEGRVTHANSGLTAEQAQVYQRIAWDTVRNYQWSGVTP